jgi:hypothetical protein
VKVNVSVPSSCWNGDNSSLIFRLADFRTIDNNCSASCWNHSSWIQMLAVGNCFGWSEEGVYWNLTRNISYSLCPYMGDVEFSQNLNFSKVNMTSFMYSENGVLPDNFSSCDYAYNVSGNSDFDLLGMINSTNSLVNISCGNSSLNTSYVVIGSFSAGDFKVNCSATFYNVNVSVNNSDFSYNISLRAT